MNRRKAIMALPFLAALPWLSKSGDGDRLRDAVDRKKKVKISFDKHVVLDSMPKPTAARAAVTVSTDNEDAAADIKAALERSRSDAAYTDHDAARDIGIALVKNQERIRIEIA